jgi:DNA-binding IclR family transcriptional regulator
MSESTSETRSEQGADWTFFSNHAHVLVCLAEDPLARLRDIAQRVGITERTTVRLITELDRAKIVKRVREGRRNRYVIDMQAPLRHSIEAHCTVGELIDTILRDRKPATAGSRKKSSSAS